MSPDEVRHREAEPTPTPASERRGRVAALLAGPVLALTVYALLGGAQAAGTLTPQGRATAAVGTLMAIWWLTEALPLQATALVPLVLLPLLGARSMSEAAAPYADKVIFLFLGGFVLGLGMERWGLHRRVALATIALAGTRPRRLVGGFMLATALVSMWVSNTATAAMMMPIGLSVIALTGARPDERNGLPAALMLGIAYAATIGGVATLIGTPPNLVLKGYVERTTGEQISFLRWMLVGVPLAAVLLPLAWAYLTRLAFSVPPGDLGGEAELLAHERAALGPMSRGERTVMIVFLATAGAWMLREPVTLVAPTAIGDVLRRLGDEGIAVLAALVLFAIPVDLRRGVFAMDWATASRLPFGILLLFGGGLSLAGAIRANGVDEFLGRAFAFLGGAPEIAVLVAVTALVVFLTELASNTAVCTALLPVVASAAGGLRTASEPLLLATAIGASLAFMLPVGTPPNAIVYASGHLTLRQMARAGLWMNLLSILVTAPMVWLLSSRVIVPMSPGSP